MKKFAILLVASFSVTCFAASAFAGSIQPGEQTSCKDANSITLEASSKADAVIWKSSNFTTVPITFGPDEDNGFEGDRHVGMASKHSKGRSSVTLTRQENFSRGDSIGDISGEVRITNTGTGPINVNCG